MKVVWILVPWLLPLLSGCIMSVIEPATFHGEPDHVIPVMTTKPKLDGQVGEGEWQDALRIESEFVIASGGAADGTYPFTLHLGIDASALHMAIVIGSAGPNPFSIPGDVWLPDRIHAYFTDADGPLESPSDELSSNNGHEFGSDLNDGYWTGSLWDLQPAMEAGNFESGYPTTGRWGIGRNTTDTLTWEFYIPRTSTIIEHDGLHLDGATDFRMALKFVRQEDTRDAPALSPPRHADSFPGDGYSLPNETDPSNWLRLRTAI